MRLPVDFPWDRLTVDVARETVEHQRWAVDGVKCPCCSQLARVYDRNLGAGVAASLIWIVNESGPDYREWVRWRNAPHRLLRTGGDFSRVAYWNFAEPKPTAAGEKSAGYWRPTSAGVAFVRGEIDAPSHVMLYNGALLLTSVSRTTVREALGRKFDYTELMSRDYTALMRGAYDADADEMEVCHFCLAESTHPHPERHP